MLRRTQGALAQYVADLTGASASEVGMFDPEACDEAEVRRRMQRLIPLLTYVFVEGEND